MVSFCERWTFTVLYDTLRLKTMNKNDDTKKTSKQWESELKMDVKVLNPDGWDRANWQYSFNEELITETEYMSRLAMSTVEWVGKK